MQSVRLTAVAGLIYGAAADLSLLRTGGHGAHGHGAHSHVHADNESTTFGGNVMERTFLQYYDLPMGEENLKSGGWTKHNSVCDPNLGFVWTEDPSGATKKRPMKLYTTAGGQPSGIGVVMLGYGSKPLPDEQAQWGTQFPLVGPEPSENLAHIDVAFRSGDIVCSGAKGVDAIGNTLILNPAGMGKKLPLNEADLKVEGWHRGSCFDTMGWHYFLDTSTKDSSMSGMAKNLLPVVVMFNEGSINAMYFSSWNNQVSIPVIASNEWEPKSLSEYEVCLNSCDKDCAFAGAPTAFSTMHIFFNDHNSVTCPADLHCFLPSPVRGNCCEKTADVIV